MNGDNVVVRWVPTLREWTVYCRVCSWQNHLAPEPSIHVWPSPLWTLPRAHAAARRHVAEHRCRDPYSWMRHCEQNGDYAGFAAAYYVANESVRARWRRGEPVWPS